MSSCNKPQRGFIFVEQPKQLLLRSRGAVSYTVRRRCFGAEKKLICHPFFPLHFPKQHGFFMRITIKNAPKI